jgi:hypothetical protein
MLPAFVSLPSGKRALTKLNHYKPKPNHIKQATAIDMNADFYIFTTQFTCQERVN